MVGCKLGFCNVELTDFYIHWVVKMAFLIWYFDNFLDRSQWVAGTTSESGTG